MRSIDTVRWLTVPGEVTLIVEVTPAVLLSGIVLGTSALVNFVPVARVVARAVAPPLAPVGTATGTVAPPAARLKRRVVPQVVPAATVPRKGAVALAVEPA